VAATTQHFKRCFKASFSLGKSRVPGGEAVNPRQNNSVNTKEVSILLVISLIKCNLGPIPVPIDSIKKTILVATLGFAYQYNSHNMIVIN